MKELGSDTKENVAVVPHISKRLPKDVPAYQEQETEG